MNIRLYEQRCRMDSRLHGNDKGAGMTNESEEGRAAVQHGLSPSQEQRRRMTKGGATWIPAFAGMTRAQE
ncbi:MAG: hypothetical protein OXC07_02795 [Kistimonas sp.]|nr:hypothetical protein [Kistimonas sp.]